MVKIPKIGNYEVFIFICIIIIVILSYSLLMSPIDPSRLKFLDLIKVKILALQC